MVSLVSLSIRRQGKRSSDVKFWNPHGREKTMPHVVIVGGGFAGMNLAKGLGGVADTDVTLVDRTNHHLFQPLLYQVAMAGLSPADIAAPIRSLLSQYQNIRVLQGDILALDLDHKRLVADFGELSFDYLVLACGARHSYFGHNEWEEYAPGLKTLEQATEIRRRVLSAYELAERCTVPGDRKRLLTFVVVGGGPTGVELAGAIGEMSRFTLAKDFRNIDAKLARVILLEAGPRILPMFSESQAARAARDLEQLGVQVWTGSAVTQIDADGVEIGSERLLSATVLWAAGVAASSLGSCAGLDVDRQGRVMVELDLSVKGHPNVFVAGDQSCFIHQTGKPLPGTAPVAMQQGRYLAATIRAELSGKPRQPFHFVDKGQMATIGRSRAIVEIGRFKMAGFMAWVAWLVVHIYYLTGFHNRLLVVLKWAWSYLTFRRGARLIVPKEWRFYKTDEKK
jgi:NADH dehydrogenase